MKLLALFLVMGSVIAAPPGMPSFKINGYSRSNIPEMTVTFENGVTDGMVLEPYSNSPCNFIGKLKTHQGSTAVTGCLNNPGDKMHITLLSDLNTKSVAYELDFDGRLTALENPFKYQTTPSGIAAPTLRVDDTAWTLHNDQMSDELENAALESAAMGVSQTVTWPGSVTAHVKFGYENTLKAQLDADSTTFPEWIDSVMTHVQTYYKHDTLPTQILLEYDTAETIFKDVSWPSTKSLNDASAAGQEDGQANVDLYAWFGKDVDYWGEIGLAWVGTACWNYYKTSFNEWRNTPVEMAWTLAHEMGHNFGMSHDFDEKHGGDNGACNKQGIMSYGNAPSKWSTCSVSDFTGYYESKDWGNTCFTKGDAVENGGGGGSNLQNSGNDCWGPCGSKQGPCAYCGDGLCCKKGWWDTSNGCNGSIGGDNFHTCVLGGGSGNGGGNGGGNSGGAPCKNSGKKSDKTCNSWAKAGYCKNNSYTKKNCKKSCGLC